MTTDVDGAIVLVTAAPSLRTVESDVRERLLIV